MTGIQKEEVPTIVPFNRRVVMHVVKAVIGNYMLIVNKTLESLEGILFRFSPVSPKIRNPSSVANS